MSKEIKPNNNRDDLWSLRLQGLSDLVANCKVFHSLFVFAYLLFITQEKHEFLYCSEQ